MLELTGSRHNDIDDIKIIRRRTILMILILMVITIMKDPFVPGWVEVDSQVLFSSEPVETAAGTTG